MSHTVCVIDYITQINSPENIFLYVMFLVPTVHTIFTGLSRDLGGDFVYVFLPHKE